MTLRLNGSTSGYVEIDAPATAGSNTLVLPTGNGTSGQVLSTNGSGALSWVDRFSAAGPAFRAYRSGNQSVTNNAFNKVALNTEDFDTNNNFDSSTNYRFTPTVAGYYQVNGAVNIEATTTAHYRVIAVIYKNGITISRGSDISLAAGSLESVVTDLVYFNGSTDYIELWGYVSVASSPLITGAAEHTYFSAFLARPA